MSLRVLSVMINVYAADAFVPSVLPGVVSSMSKICLDKTRQKGWVNGEVVAASLNVLRIVILKSISDERCIAEGAVRSVVNLEDLQDLAGSGEERKPPDPPPFCTARTATWLRASSTQLHIALNSLSVLTNHPTPAASNALSAFAFQILQETSLTLPQSQPLLLSWLLSLSNSTFSGVSELARNNLFDLFVSPSLTTQTLLETLLQISQDSLAALPRSIAAQSDARVEHIAGQIEAVCTLATLSEDNPKAPLASIRQGVSILLGPSGGIEKWGWALLSVLELSTPSVSVNHPSIGQLFLEGSEEDADSVTFPDIELKNVVSRSAQERLARMFWSLGRTCGDNGLYAVDWFFDVGRNLHSGLSPPALWCAARLLEGMGSTQLFYQAHVHFAPRFPSQRFLAYCRGLSKNISEWWDEEEEDRDTEPNESLSADDHSLRTEVKKGLSSIKLSSRLPEPLFDIGARPSMQPALRKSLALHLLAISGNILQARFTPMFIYVLYPILHSIVSPVPSLSLTGLSTLNTIANATSYASPANLLLSNFDYALDSVSRRLSRRWLDMDAPKVLAVLVRLVGSEVVQKAGDVVEECFDRLDEYHGYSVIVEGLVEVLGEVVKVIELDEPRSTDQGGQVKRTDSHTLSSLQPFLHWVSHRRDPAEEDATDYGRAPRRPWGEPENEEDEAARGPSDMEKEPDFTPSQALTQQMVSRSVYFLTHQSPVIRARILNLLASASAVLPESALLPSIHKAWPFILNRFDDAEQYIVSAAAGLVENLAIHVGSFMTRRVWSDIWPRFMRMLAKLDEADSRNALARRGSGAVGTASAYTHSHRLYRSILRTMEAAVKGVDIEDSTIWQVTLACRRFLHCEAHEELQALARLLYQALTGANEDAVWVALMSTLGKLDGEGSYLRESRWDIENNAMAILGTSW